jgi:hypothetical protein
MARVPFTNESDGSVGMKSYTTAGSPTGFVLASIPIEIDANNTEYVLFTAPRAFVLKGASFVGHTAEGGALTGDVLIVDSGSAVSAGTSVLDTAGSVSQINFNATTPELHQALSLDSAVDQTLDVGQSLGLNLSATVATARGFLTALLAVK